MPSLKDLKNRIASVKSTRKITKAMQMVAAAKLRRAQEAAEASRPYTERFNAVLGGLASSVGASGSAPKLLSGTGSDNVHLLMVMTAERGLCGGFNSSIAKLARQHANDLIAAGKTVKIVTVGKKGRDVIRRDLGQHFIDHVDMTEVKRVGYDDARSIAQNLLARFDSGEFDVATLFFSEFVNVVTQIPTAQQIIPAAYDRAVVRARHFTITNPMRPQFWQTFCRVVWPHKSLRPCWRTEPLNRARGCQQWITQHATRAK